VFWRATSLIGSFAGGGTQHAAILLQLYALVSSASAPFDFSAETCRPSVVLWCLFPRLPFLRLDCGTKRVRMRVSPDLVPLMSMATPPPQNRCWFVGPPHSRLAVFFALVRLVQVPPSSPSPRSGFL